MKIFCCKVNPPIGALFVAEHIKTAFSKEVTIEWGTDSTIQLDDGSSVEYCSTNDLVRVLARAVDEGELWGLNALEKSEVDSWLCYAQGQLAAKEDFPAAIQYLERIAGQRKYLVGNRITIADFAVLGALIANPQWQSLLSTTPTPAAASCLAWYSRLCRHPAVQQLVVRSGVPEEVRAQLSALPTQAPSAGRRSAERVTAAAAGGRAQEGKFVDLPGAEMGKVVVRFPPEASGYLHIGHAKAALLNQYYQQTFQGRLIMRFDDTNPAKEDAHFEQVILEDVAMLQIQPDLFTHTSQYFDVMLGYCEQLMREGAAYADDTEPDRMREEREQRLESTNRNNTLEKNMKMWEEMKAGSPYGQKCCVRAKIDMQSPNGCMRDPTIYRCKNEPHPRTGTKYKVYPTYDFACPIVDAIEDVTHTLRTMEYHDRDAQFYWFIEKLGLRRPYIWEYSRLSMTNTVLSKRKLTWFVQEGFVDGWDDARMPTVRGVLRRGMTVEGLKQFIIAQGSSRSVVFMEWDKIWAFNKKVIDPIAPRYTALDFKTPVQVQVKGVKTEKLSVAKHPKNTDVGMKDVWISDQILIDMVDAQQLKENENTTFINWGNLLIKKITKQNGVITSVEAEPNLDNKDYKKTLKLTWLAKAENVNFTPTYCVYFDHIISKALLGKDEDFKQFIAKDTRKEVKMLGDPELKKLKHGDIIQLQRIGFFKVDIPYEPVNPYTCREQPVVLFYIPDGHTKESPNTNVAKAKVDEKSQQPQKQTTEPSKQSSGRSPADIDADITGQGDQVRNLKSQKASKADIDVAVKVLLALKVEYKSATGTDWKPGSAITVPNPQKVDSGEDISARIAAQGDKIRVLKSEKAAKDKIDPEVKQLLALKAEFKATTGSEWKPEPAPIEVKSTTASVTTPATSDTDVNAVLQQIATQGNAVRDLKAQKADKQRIDGAVKRLLELKGEYKKLTGQEWKPGTVPASVEKVANVTQSGGEKENVLLGKITEQGDQIRTLKAQKADQTTIKSAVDVLLKLKAEYKTDTGKEWKPGMAAAAPATAAPATAVRATAAPALPAAAGDNTASEQLTAKVNAQGELVRHLKANKATKDAIDEAVKQLLSLKAEYKSLTGTDFPAPIRGKPEPKKDSKPKETQKAKPAPKQSTPNPKPPKEVKESETSGLKKQTRLGLEARKEESLSDWYSQVITKGEMIEYYDVSGCYILRPWSFAIWDAIRDWFDPQIKKLGVQNCYFPIFVSKAVLEKEKTHIADFAPEVAWVTRSGDSEMAEPIAVRPTSETIMYPAYAKWIQSHRDLPIKLNQWNNVVRWEFSNPQPFLRTREFLWQEGHTAHAQAADAQAEVFAVLELYARIYTDLLAVPVIRGRKTEKEKFAGGDFTTTVEAYVSASGRAVQGATSHYLGLNFSRMFEIAYECPDTKQKLYVHQNSWGISTRTIGVMIMVHADNQGLVLPPRVASVQTVIVPCGITVQLSDTDRNHLHNTCTKLEEELRANGVRVNVDYRDNYSPGWKFNHWELKGVPIRIEVGPKDVQKNQLVAVRRDTGEKVTIQRANAVEEIGALLDNIQKNLYNNALNDMNSHKVILKSWDNFCSSLEQKNIILSPFCGEVECETKIKADSARDASENAEPGAPSMGAKSLCIPFDQPADIVDSDRCVHPACNNKPKFYTLFGRSY